MSYDRFIAWQGSERPTKHDVEVVIEDFLGAAFDRMEWKGSRFNVWLHGHDSAPLRRTSLPLPAWYRPLAEEDARERRFLEVFFDENTADHFSIITRHADEYTNALAEGLAQIIARAWNGKVEQG